MRYLNLRVKMRGYLLILCSAMLVAGFTGCDGAIHIFGKRPLSDNSPNPQNMQSIIVKTLSDNTTTNVTEKESVSGNQPDVSTFARLSMAKAMWTIQESNDTTENNQTINSVPIPSNSTTNSTFKIPSPFRNYNPLGVINKVTGSAVVLKQIQAKYAQSSLNQMDTSQKLPTPERASVADTIRTLDSRFGVYIPMEKLNRVRRQVTLPPDMRNSTSKKGRILMLMNPNETSIDQSMFKKSVLMLVKQPEEPSILNQIPNVVSIENQGRVEKLLQAYQFKPIAQNVELREVLEREPAIQRVNLNNIELAIPNIRELKNRSEAVTSGSNNNNTDIQKQIKRLLEILVIQTRPNSSNNNNSPLPPSQIDHAQQMGPGPTHRQTPPIPTPHSAHSNPLASGSGFNNNRVVNLRQDANNRVTNTRQDTNNKVTNIRQETTNRITNRRQDNIRNSTSGNRLVNFRHSSRPGLTGSNVLNVRAPGRSSPSIGNRGPGSSVRVPTMNNNLRAQMRSQGSGGQRVASAGGSRTRGSVRPSLTRQVPINTRRIAPSRSSRTRTGTGSTRLRPLVRAISSRTLRQPTRRGSLRGTIRTPPRRRQFIQRMRLSDPFTQRFSAGFQRGSSLLHQPPLNITSFDVSVREANTGGATGTGAGNFNPFGSPFGTPFIPGPSLGGLGGVPPVFGNNMFLGPSLL